MSLTALPAHSWSAACAGSHAEGVAVLPDVDVLLAQREVVQVGFVAVLAAERRKAVVLVLERGGDSERRAVVLGQDRVDLLVVELAESMIASMLVWAFFVSQAAV